MITIQSIVPYEMVVVSTQHIKLMAGQIYECLCHVFIKFI